MKIKVVVAGVVHVAQDRGVGGWRDTDCAIREYEWNTYGRIVKSEATVTCMSCLSAPVTPAGEAHHVRNTQDLPRDVPRGTAYWVGVLGDRRLYVFGDLGWQLWNA